MALSSSHQSGSLPLFHAVKKMFLPNSGPLHLLRLLSEVLLLLALVHSLYRIDFLQYSLKKSREESISQRERFEDVVNSQRKQVISERKRYETLLKKHGEEVDVSKDFATTDSSKCCGPSCRGRLIGAAKFYDEKYFRWQTRLGLQKARQIDFNTLLDVRPNETVADLGAGGGHILASLNVAKRVGVELNDYARSQITQVYPDKNIELYRYVENVPDESIDVFFSTSVIEHMECPLTELREVFRKVRPGGRLVIGIKNEGVQYLRRYVTFDQDNHLYTWNELLLGNLVRAAGFTVEKILPTAAERRTTAESWKRSDLSRPTAFVYHWCYAVKPATLVTDL